MNNINLKVIRALLSSNMLITWSCAKTLKKSSGFKLFQMEHSALTLSSSSGKCFNGVCLIIDFCFSIINLFFL